MSKSLGGQDVTQSAGTKIPTPLHKKKSERGRLCRSGVEASKAYHCHRYGSVDITKDDNHD